MDWIEPNVLAAIGTGLAGIVFVVSLLGAEGYRNMTEWDESPRGGTE